jgi:type IV pilus assembly protein PilN
MIRINLLGVHKVKKVKTRNWLGTGIIAGYLLFLVGALLAYWLMTDHIANQKREKAELEAKTRKNVALQKEIQILKAKKALAQNRLTILKNLDQNRQSPVQLMEFLCTTLPVNQLWLISLKEVGPEIRLEGMSMTNEILADFIRRLEKGPVFKQVDLTQSVQASYKNMKVKQFTLVAWTEIPPPPAPPKEKK